jgi:fucose permease
MIHIYGDCQSLFAIACEICFVVTTANTIMKDATHKKNAKRMAIMTMTIKMEGEGAISETETLLIL